jgi:DHA1 family bicyclomycin/chloramphenicol resistance-like MFS transporter
MYLAGFGQMAETFQTTSAKVGATLSAFFLGLALGQAVYGPVIDRYGRRWPLLIGIGVFSLASLGCILIQDIDLFIAVRLLQALGGCSGMIIGRAIVNDLFTPQEGARALSLRVSIMILAPIGAPMLGGLILSFASWRVIFGVVLAFSLCAGWLVWRYIPETLAPGKAQPIDARSVARAYLALCRRPKFIVPALVGGLGSSCLFAFITGSPFLLMNVFGVSEQQYSMLFGLNAFGIGVGAQLNRVCLRRWTPQQMLGAGLCIILAAGFALLAVAGTSHLALFMTPLCIMLSSMGFLIANAAAVAMSATGPNGGSGSALIGALQFSIAFVVSSLVSATQSNSPYPMSIAVAACGLLANGVWLMRRRK